MLLQKTCMFAQLSDCWWKNTVLRRKNTNPLTSVCGLGLEHVTLSDGTTFSPHPGAKTKKTTTITGAAQRALRRTELQFASKRLLSRFGTREY